MPLKATALAALRRMLRGPWREGLLLRLTIGRDPGALASRLAPRHTQYPAGAIRRVRRYGLAWELDVSERNQWYLYWGFRDASHDAYCRLLRPGDVVVDVGANIGVTALRAASIVGPGGTVHAMEPDPANYRHLERNVRLNREMNVQLWPIGLGAMRGGAGIVRDLDNSGQTCLDFRPSELTPAEERVPVETLDQLCATGQIARADVIKIDTEGAELDVLLGAVETLRRCRPRFKWRGSRRQSRHPLMLASARGPIAPHRRCALLGAGASAA